MNNEQNFRTHNSNKYTIVSGFNMEYLHELLQQKLLIKTFIKHK